MSFTLILAEVLDFFQPLKYSINHNVFKIKVKCYFFDFIKKKSAFILRAIARSGKSPARGKGRVFCQRLDKLLKYYQDLRTGTTGG
jgi:hypothetical protein